LANCKRFPLKELQLSAALIWPLHHLLPPWIRSIQIQKNQSAAPTTPNQAPARLSKRKRLLYKGLRNRELAQKLQIQEAPNSRTQRHRRSARRRRREKPGVPYSTNCDANSLIRTPPGNPHLILASAQKEKKQTNRKPPSSTLPADTQHRKTAHTNSPKTAGSKTRHRHHGSSLATSTRRRTKAATPTPPANLAT